jgi:hypothetical protein
MKIFALAAVMTAALAFAAPTLQAATLTTQDYIDIEQLYAQYNQAIDTGDAQGWAATFTADGVFNRFSGKDALAGFVNQWREKMNGANRRHWNTNLRIVGTPEGANGSVYLMLVDVSTKPVSIITTGTYTDTLVKTAEGWRFKTRTTHSDTSPGSAPAAAPAKP